MNSEIRQAFGCKLNRILGDNYPKHAHQKNYRVSVVH
ncbi:unnamed protein product, partial [Rotaria magnacalcarata]